MITSSLEVFLKHFVGLFTSAEPQLCSLSHKTDNEFSKIRLHIYTENKHFTYIKTHMHILLLSMRNLLRPSATSDSCSIDALIVQGWEYMSINISSAYCSMTQKWIIYSRKKIRNKGGHMTVLFWINQGTCYEVHAICKRTYCAWSGRNATDTELLHPSAVLKNADEHFILCHWISAYDYGNLDLVLEAPELSLLKLWGTALFQTVRILPWKKK